MLGCAGKKGFWCSHRPCRTIGASAIHFRSMDELTEADVRKIEQIHSSWIEFEVAGEDHNLMALCADDIELWPPDAQPLLGRAAVSARDGAWEHENSLY